MANQLGGAIPSVGDEMLLLTNVSLASNNFIGPIPEGFFRGSGLTMDLSENKIYGPFPTKDTESFFSENFKVYVNGNCFRETDLKSQGYLTDRNKYNLTQRSLADCPPEAANAPFDKKSSNSYYSKLAPILAGVIIPAIIVLTLFAAFFVSRWRKRKDAQKKALEVERNRNVRVIVLERFDVNEKEGAKIVESGVLDGRLDVGPANVPIFVERKDAYF
ncbi:hypothetical protein HDU97_010019 [Phlyctochytrium planicorne]|nr:hypothetical protein HDU97_010019 [Phlyctochytrium planicorne]